MSTRTISTTRTSDQLEAEGPTSFTLGAGEWRVTDRRGRLWSGDDLVIVSADGDTFIGQVNDDGELDGELFLELR